MEQGLSLPDRTIGVIAPSANLVVEWTVGQLLRAAPSIGAVVSRVRVAGSVDPFPDGYDRDGFLAASSLIADARPQAIVWAGSKGVLVGADRDRALAAMIEEATGLPATSSTLALMAFAARTGLTRIGLITPYADAYQARLIAGFAALGIEVLAERHAGLADNLGYASVGPAWIGAMADAIAAEADGRAEALVAWCTNLAAAPLATAIEGRTGLTFLDATALALHHGLALAGADIPPVPGWGRLFTSASHPEPPCVC